MKPTKLTSFTGPFVACLLLLGAASAQSAVDKVPSAGDIPPGLGITADGKAAVKTDGQATANTRSDIEQILWDNTPLAVTLSVGQERMVSFPGNVRLGIPASLSMQLRTLSQNGTVYWLASQAFATTRIQAQDTRTGQFYLIDLAATAKPVTSKRLQLIAGFSYGVKLS